MRPDKTPQHRLIKRLLKRIPFIRSLVRERDALRLKVEELGQEITSANSAYNENLARLSAERDRFNTGFAPGHYYSSVPDLRELQSRDASLFGRMPESIAGVELNADGQQDLLSRLSAYYGELPFSQQRQPGLRYYYENPNFSYCDGIILYAMIRHLRPARIIEIGCGFSSCVSLDTNERFFNNAIQCTFIDPFPQLLNALLKPEDSTRIRIIQDCVQDVPLGVFAELEENDILFVDSSHVLKTGGDLNRILFDVLPTLRPGVHIHFHDTPYPFEYPREWVFAGRAWNECYALRAFLQHNDAYEILYFNSYLTRRHRTFFEQNMPLCLRNEGGSLWLRKLKATPWAIEDSSPVPPFLPSHMFDAVYLAHPQQLGGGWYECEKDLAGRWTGIFAEVVMRGPDLAGRQIVLKGAQPNPTGVNLSVTADAVLVGGVRLPHGRFSVTLPLPDNVVGCDRIILRLQLDKAYVPPDDGRELGLSFGTIEIQ